jgi:hypothetical protein
VGQALRSRAGRIRVTADEPAAERIGGRSPLLGRPRLGSVGRSRANRRTHGIAVCDTDPLKLHYAWSLWRIGEFDEGDLRRQIVAYREAVAEGRLGFADRYCVEIPAADVLAERKVNDALRRRRNFDLHARLGEPLREWYGAIEELRPGCVVWNYPARLPGRLPRQTDHWPGDIVTFDRLTERLIEAP